MALAWVTPQTTTARAPTRPQARHGRPNRDRVEACSRRIGRATASIGDGKRGYV